MNDQQSQPLLPRNDDFAHARVQKIQACPDCRRQKNHCLCGKVTAFSNKLRVVLLQHPQEQYKQANSAALTHLILRNSTLLTGLSWRSFKSVAGEDELPAQWAILYLKHGQKTTGGEEKPLYIFDKNDKPLETIPQLHGIIAIDGSWKQAKTIWWRNSWFLKLNRISLNPDFQSLRNQSKEEGLSTIEAVAFTLQHLGEKEVIANSMIYQYKKKILGSREI